MSGARGPGIIGDGAARLRRRRFPVNIAFTLQMLLLAGLTALSGCTLAGAAASKVTGPPKVHPLYTPAKQPMLVLAENYTNPSQAMFDAEHLARAVSRELEKHKVAPIIDPVRAIDLRSAQPAPYREMSIAEIGRSLGAQQVLYIDVRVSGIVMAEASDIMKATMLTRVRIIDTATGDTLWPTDAYEGYQLVYETPLQRQSRNLTEDALRLQAARGMGQRIARLFYAYHSDDPRPG